MSKLCSSKCVTGSRTEMGLISDLIKQEKQVRRGRLASANPTNPAGRPAVFCKLRGRDVW
jgi:hypothetical protein